MVEIRALLSEPMVDSRAYWDAADRNQLLLAKCGTCGHRFFYPRILCPSCGSREIEQTPSAGSGSIYSFTHVHFSPSGDFWAQEIPFTVILVDLDEGPRMLSRLISDTRAAVKVGDRVRVSFSKVRDSEHQLPTFDFDR
jgi:uncharacterized OB-fold protein